ncbi:type III-B CRISPR module-associated Cmr3 family protein [Accumulibacter sp.]|uniref:type III-B CRISPR module-associated Cmr3 family protein n=1 Tax=Accumulibacter sp. TaxID=2053492 RepID=UPI0025F90756|nr:type III-B CRISPR module-associated Cmr3 family protein [Accumulibacter sp.]MCM8611176.1 type III-B CRISPR module-associated protein Cmr3 [Accumulibacter sp.]MCM8634322.1 type III-B CRISPR module-associated protein Cmr3 [Accumulibacter sp.]MCM8641646.1 type III-B CRISPR module-associated protein Cmr3 [Accumulibacter sp.]
MKPVETRFLEPLDVLFLRGNKLFGDPGSFGESLVPPWPSVAAGAIRSRMLADAGVDLAAFARGEIDHPALGTPQRPGDFAVTAFHLARRHADGSVEALVQPPADLVIGEADAGSTTIRSLTPIPLLQAGGLQCSAPLPLLPVLAEAERSKPAGGWWLTEAGWRRYLAGGTPNASDLARSSELWALDHRVGVGLDAATRRAADGRLFSLQAVAMTKRGHRIGTEKGTRKAILADYDVGFLATISGATPPADGPVRLGGDGRAAAIRSATATLPEPDFDAIAGAGRCRMILATPGLFTGGWLPTGSTQQADGSHRFELYGVRGRLVCAAVPRAEVISGWDLAQWQPKAAQRAAPAGSVWWLDELEATTTALRKLAAKGLWGDPCEDAARRAEGFNRIALAAWK